MQSFAKFASHAFVECIEFFFADVKRISCLRCAIEILEFQMNRLPSKPDVRDVRLRKQCRDCRETVLHCSTPTQISRQQLALNTEKYLCGETSFNRVTNEQPDRSSSRETVVRQLSLGMTRLHRRSPAVQLVLNGIANVQSLFSGRSTETTK